jgi:hypothetical protein
MEYSDLEQKLQQDLSTGTNTQQQQQQHEQEESMMMNMYALYGRSPSLSLMFGRKSSLSHHAKMMNQGGATNTIMPTSPPKKGSHQKSPTSVLTDLFHASVSSEASYQKMDKKASDMSIRLDAEHSDADGDDDEPVIHRQAFLDASEEEEVWITHAHEDEQQEVWDNTHREQQQVWTTHEDEDEPETTSDYDSTVAEPPQTPKSVLAVAPSQPQSPSMFKRSPPALKDFRYVYHDDEPQSPLSPQSPLFKRSGSGDSLALKACLFQHQVLFQSWLDHIQQYLWAMYHTHFQQQQVHEAKENVENVPSKTTKLFRFVRLEWKEAV